MRADPKSWAPHSLLLLPGGGTGRSGPAVSNVDCVTQKQQPLGLFRPFLSACGFMPPNVSHPQRHGVWAGLRWGCGPGDEHTLFGLGRVPVLCCDQVLFWAIPVPPSQLPPHQSLPRDAKGRAHPAGHTCLPSTLPFAVPLLSLFPAICRSRLHGAHGPAASHRAASPLLSLLPADVLCEYQRGPRLWSAHAQQLQGSRRAPPRPCRPQGKQWTGPPPLRQGPHTSARDGAIAHRGVCSADLEDPGEGGGMWSDAPFVWGPTHLGEPLGSLWVLSAHPFAQKSKPPSSLGLPDSYSCWGS